MAANEVVRAGSPLSPLGTLNSLLTQYRAQIAMALPKHLTPERMIRVALTAVSQSTKLQQCDPMTICGAVIQASILGLEPNAVLGEAFLVPFKNNKRRNPSGGTGVMECQLQVGYKGHVKLARQSGEIAMIDAQLVRENDIFDFEKGANPWIKHKWPQTGERGKWIGCWAGFKTKDGEFQFEYMTEAEIIEHRDKFSKSIYNNKIVGPWVDNPEWMWKKTVVIKVLKLAPKSVAVATAVTLTEQSDAGIPQAFSVDVPLELHSPGEDDDSDTQQEESKVEMPKRASAAAEPPPPAAEQGSAPGELFQPQKEGRDSLGFASESVHAGPGAASRQRPR